jgi:PiT family inorganic phosphate transporter
VRWIVARSIGIAWVLTIPAAGLMAAGSYLLVTLVLELL